MNVEAHHGLLRQSQRPSADQRLEKVKYHPPTPNRGPIISTTGTYAGEIQSGKYTLRDFNFQKSTLQLEARSSGQKFTDLEVYDYPGLFQETGNGETRVGIRLGEMAVGSAVVGGGPVYGLTTGALLRSTDHPREDQNMKYLIVAATYDLESDESREAAQNCPALTDLRFPGHFEQQAVPPAPLAPSLRARPADGDRRRPFGRRRHLHRRVRPRESAVPLGPTGQERRKQFLLDPRGLDLGRQRLGRHPASRA